MPGTTLQTELTLERALEQQNFLSSHSLNLGSPSSVSSSGSNRAASPPSSPPLTPPSSPMAVHNPFEALQGPLMQRLTSLEKEEIMNELAAHQQQLTSMVCEQCWIFSLHLSLFLYLLYFLSLFH